MAGSTHQALLVIAAKAPVAGGVKTRLCPALAPETARDLYRCFLQDRLAEMGALEGVDVSVAYTPADARDYFSGFAAGGFRLFPQRGNDLGARLSDIFQRKSAEGYAAIAVIDSDSPDLPRTIVAQSFKWLASGAADAVFGPCFDGGYYLAGLRRPRPELFQDIPWSTAGVLAKTLAIAAAGGLQTKLLSRWNDLDTFADLLGFYRRYKDHPPQSGWPGHRTFRYLSSLECITRNA